uniref:Cysteine protease n=1 Tax=Sinocyclocheilus rhinocerous TaxID=307959 RepID=A0A673IN25_9TELE
LSTATLTYDSLRFGEIEDFPETSEPVWILGKQFSALTEKDEILADVTSRLWFTYRKNFQPIGGTGPTSDTGWGCMLRCGQMILGQALICRHLGRDWRWSPGQRQRAEYINILNAFIDKKDSYYSIHQIAQMGVGEGKSIGQWYGPNTVAQVLKKLAVFDSWSRLAVHVAMDNTVVIEEIITVSIMPNFVHQGFFCQTEDDFDDWCAQIRKVSNCRGLPMFELVDSQPSHLITADVLNLTPDFSDSDRLERFFDSEDEEFEILSL